MISIFLDTIVRRKIPQCLSLIALQSETEMQHAENFEICQKSVLSLRIHARVSL